MPSLEYSSRSGIAVRRISTRVPYRRGLQDVLEHLNRNRGVYLSSGYEFPGRYSRWDIASICPPLEVLGGGAQLEFRPLNQRGVILNQLLLPVLESHDHWDDLRMQAGAIIGQLRPSAQRFAEEERSKQPSFFSILRELIQEFRHPSDSTLCFIGAFGYDLLFQFDPIHLKLPRGDHRDLHLFLCDDLWMMDRKRERIERFEYEFSGQGRSTAGHPRDGEPVKEALSRADLPVGIVSDQTPEEYMAGVERVREGMRRGDYYEVVLRQTFSTPYSGPPAALFERIQQASPSPYEFLLQLGDEQLIGASPEMFVRVEGARVETCPIAGTARRTGDPLLDAASIRDLLNSEKEESELTMCTDVDRNDKSRVCQPGSVRVIGRRLIESYAGIFHTVDHVEGLLAEGFDSLDAFLAHMWAVTLVGAPKKAAAQAIEDLEKSARGWYGGAVGVLSLNGDINTGILIRTIHLRDGVAQYPAGATVLYDSDPAAEEQETRLKATGFFRVLGSGNAPAIAPAASPVYAGARRPRLLLVDNEDCFIHTLANYARQTGAEVFTYRAPVAVELIEELGPDLILISPGPRRPEDFGVPALVRYAAAQGIPAFGVCLGLQGMVEAFGGELSVLDYPMHGKPSIVRHNGRGVFGGLPETFKIGRYHSLFAKPDRLPDCLEVTATSEDGVIMGVLHRSLPLEAVQFHPESLLSLEGNCGFRLMENAVRLYGAGREAKAGTHSAPHPLPRQPALRL